MFKTTHETPKLSIPLEPEYRLRALWTGGLYEERSKVLEDLVGAIRKRQAILFAGAGVSMTVGLPSWNTLIEHVAEELDIDPSQFKGTDLNYLTLAEFYRIKQGS